MLQLDLTNFQMNREFFSKRSATYKILLVSKHCILRYDDARETTLNQWFKWRR